jgi:tetratricopeptide (TPR) repeat protein
MKKTSFQICLAICLIAVLCSNVFSQARSQIFIGARPLGLGETFTAIADDGNAVYWNPAGLPTLKRIEFNSMYANLYGMEGLKNLYLSFVYPVTPRYVLGISWFDFGFDDDELEFYRDKANLSFGANVYRNLFLGANVKYINTDARLDGYSEGKAYGFGFDLGGLYSVPVKRGIVDHVNLGLMAHDVGGTSITYSDTKNSEKVLPQNIRFGFAIYPKDEISLKLLTLSDALLAFDFDDRFHFGTEAWLFENLALRTGIQKDFHTGESPTYSIGASIKFPFISVKLDYAYVIPPTLSSTHLFSLSFVPTMSPIKITDVTIDDVFASLYKTYAMAKQIGSVTIRNDYDKDLKMTLKVDIPELTDLPSQETFTLAPNEQRTTAFSVTFSKNIMEIKEPQFRQAKISVEYKIKNEQKYANETKKFRLFGRGAITWEDAGKAVSFITKLDRMVELFAREVTKDLPFKSEVELGNIYTAAVLFDAMGAAEIKYQRDPARPFSLIPKTQHSVDHIQYPAELLTSNQGECDDLTVLYAALLEHLGINTALVSTDDHIWLMFDTGIHERNWGLLPMGDSLVVVKNKTLWIPVEVTEVGNSFATAWQAGGKRYRESQHDENFEVVVVKDVEGIYLSALPEEYQDQVPGLPGASEFKMLVDNDFNWIEHRRSNFTINHYVANLKKQPDDVVLRNKLGIIYAQQDLIEQAETQFKTITRRHTDNAEANNNLANVECITGRFKDAEKHYLTAIKSLPDEAGLYLNLAILYQLWMIENPADSLRFQDESEKNLFHAFQLLKGDDVYALDLLGIAEEEIDVGEKADFKSWFKQQATGIKKFIKNNAKKYLFNKTVKGARVERKAVKRGPDRDRTYILWWADVGF